MKDFKVFEFSAVATLNLIDSTDGKTSDRRHSLNYASEQIPQPKFLYRVYALICFRKIFLIGATVHDSQPRRITIF
jgi:hypothetical protein